MAKHPEAYIDFEVYENGKNFLGISKATLPNLSFITQQINGSAILGNIDVPLIGQVEAMELTLNFRSATDAAVSLMSPKKHNIDLRVAEQYWDTASSGKTIQADKYVMVVEPKSTNPGNVATASAADTSGTYSVYYYAGYKNGKKLWEVDQFNGICNIGGTDYAKAVRKALGK